MGTARDPFRRGFILCRCNHSWYLALMSFDDPSNTYNSIGPTVMMGQIDPQCHVFYLFRSPCVINMSFIPLCEYKETVHCTCVYSTNTFPHYYCHRTRTSGGSVYVWCVVRRSLANTEHTCRMATADVGGQANTGKSMIQDICASWYTKDDVGISPGHTAAADFECVGRGKFTLDLHEGEFEVTDTSDPRKRLCINAKTGVVRESTLCAGLVTSPYAYTLSEKEYAAEGIAVCLHGACTLSVAAEGMGDVVWRVVCATHPETWLEIRNV